MIIVPRGTRGTPGTWQPSVLDNKDTAYLTCPNGHGGYLEDHTIHRNGHVEPSVVCPTGECDFHEHIILQGWEA